MRYEMTKDLETGNAIIDKEHSRVAFKMDRAIMVKSIVLSCTFLRRQK